jgi:hypothetical protein
MTDRILPVEEWPRLAGTDLFTVLPYLPASETTIIVVEDDDGTIVGCWATFRVHHAEGVWVAPAYRHKVSVARRLWRRMRQVILERGAESMVTAAMAPEIDALLAKRAQALPQEYMLCLR